MEALLMVVSLAASFALGLKLATPDVVERERIVVKEVLLKPEWRAPTLQSFIVGYTGDPFTHEVKMTLTRNGDSQVFMSRPSLFSEKRHITVSVPNV